jgi:TonB-linked SusC/RagA family outer membrane protein
MVIVLISLHCSVWALGPGSKLTTDITVTGQVTDSAMQALSGVTVQVKGSKVGTVTDAQGHYEIKSPADATLIFSFISYQKREIAVNGQTVINVIMQTSSTGLNEVVVTGYSTQKKSLVTGSIATLDDVYKLKTVPSTSLGNLLAGKLAGVNVSTPDGIPGDQPGISVRTVSSWNDQPVLYIIDGKISGSGDFNNLSPNMIKSISVLKDAAAAAVYGSRAAGGVVIVTTRRGQKGKAVIDFSYNRSIDTRTKNVSLTSAVQAGELYDRINPNSDPAGWAWTQSDLDYFKNIHNGWGYDQLNVVWQNPSISTYNLSASGGGDKVTYFIGGSYVKQQGFLSALTYDKYNVRANVTANLTKDFQLFAGLALNNDLTGHMVWEGPQAEYSKLLVWQPDQPVFTNTGKPIDYGWIANIGATVRGDGGYIKSNHLKPYVNLNARYNFSFIPGLSAKASYSSSFAFDRTKYFQKNYLMYVMQKKGKHIISTNDTGIVSTKMSTNISPAYLEDDVSWGQDYQLDFQLNYDHTFNEVHHIQALLVYEKFQSKGGGVNAGRQNFPVYTTDQWWATSSSREDSYVGGPTDYTSGRISYVGQVNYDYKGKYLGSFSFREDGSMNFAPDKRWGFFPAGALGWIVSKEPFLSHSGVIDFLKLRLSAGLTGNDAVGGWQWEESYNSGNAAYFGTNPSKSSGITYGSVVNPGLTWEKSLTYNAGIDMNLRKHWQTTAEYWFRKTYDILGPRTASVPPTFSLSLPDENYGQINAQGVDFSLNYNNNTGDFSYYAGLTASYGWNKVVIKDYSENAKSYSVPLGRSTSYIWGLESDGIIRTQADLDKYTNASYNYNGVAPALGQLVYKDISGPNGKPDGIINDYDNVILKKNNFPIVYGLTLGGSWKGFQVDIMFNGDLKQLKNYENLAGGVEWNRMWVAWYNNSWTPDNPNAMLPQRISANDGSATYRNGNADFWYRDASFIRLKYVTLNYTLPTRWYNKHGLDAIKLFFSGANLFEWSDFKYYDPELGSGVAYPIMRSFSFGADIKF